MELLLCNMHAKYYALVALSTIIIWPKFWQLATLYGFQPDFMSSKKIFMGSSKNIFNGFQEDFYEFQPDFYGFQPDFKIFMSSSKNVLFYGRNPSIQGLTQPARWLQAKSTAVK